MTPIPPYFQSQMEEQQKWDDGFKAGIAEVVNSLAESASSEELDGSTQDWVKDFTDKMTKKYL
jgi:hypothetical protein